MARPVFRRVGIEVCLTAEPRRLGHAQRHHQAVLRTFPDRLRHGSFQLRANTQLLTEYVYWKGKCANRLWDQCAHNHALIPHPLLKGPKGDDYDGQEAE